MSPNYFFEITHNGSSIRGEAINGGLLLIITSNVYSIKSKGHSQKIFLERVDVEKMREWLTKSYGGMPSVSSVSRLLSLFQPSRDSETNPGTPIK